MSRNCFFLSPPNTMQQFVCFFIFHVLGIVKVLFIVVFFFLLFCFFFIIDYSTKNVRVKSYTFIYFRSNPYRKQCELRNVIADIALL